MTTPSVLSAVETNLETKSIYILMLISLGGAQPVIPPNFYSVIGLRNVIYNNLNGGALICNQNFENRMI